jgi:hypothetical protein
VVEGSEQWLAWVGEGADHMGTDMSKLVDAALLMYLREAGFTKDRPRRVP